MPELTTKNSNDSPHNEEFGAKANALHDDEVREHEMGFWVS